jgi:uncharacterized membrane protein YqjE
MALWASLRTLFGTGLSLLCTRLELLGLEWAQERQRWLGFVLWAALALLLVFLGCLLATVVLALFLFHLLGALAVVFMALAYLVLGLGVLLWLRTRLRREPRPWAASREVFRQDREALLEALRQAPEDSPHAKPR